MDLDAHFEAVLVRLEVCAEESIRLRKVMQLSQSQLDRFFGLEKGSIAVLEKMTETPTEETLLAVMSFVKMLKELPEFLDEERKKLLT